MLMNSVLHNFSLRSDNGDGFGVRLILENDPHCPSLDVFYLSCLLFCKVRVRVHAYSNTDRMIEVYMLMRW